VISADTSSLIAYFQGEVALDTKAVQLAVDDQTLHLSPIVISELLSDLSARSTIERVVLALPRLEPKAGYWERCGFLRRTLILRGFKARVSDALIAQSSIDYSMPLITRDTDFRHFVKHCGLKLA
jgi:predicted nucleic acid-binding protein